MPYGGSMFTSSPSPPTSTASSQPHQRSALSIALLSLQYSLAFLPFVFVLCQSVWVGRVFQLIGHWPHPTTEPLFTMPNDQLYDLLSQVAEGTLILSFVSSVLFPF